MISFVSPGFDPEISVMALSSTDPNVLCVEKGWGSEYGIPGSLSNEWWWTNWNTIARQVYRIHSITQSMDVHSNDPSIAYISMAGFSAGNEGFKHQMPDNHGRIFLFNLPNLPVNCVKMFGADMLLAAMDIGVYVPDSASSTWGLFSTGLSKCDCDWYWINNEALNKIKFTSVHSEEEFGKQILECL